MFDQPLATITAMISSALWTRLRPWKRNAKASASATSSAVAGVRRSGVRTFEQHRRSTRTERGIGNRDFEHGFDRTVPPRLRSGFWFLSCTSRTNINQRLAIRIASQAHLITGHRAEPGETILAHFVQPSWLNAPKAGTCALEFDCRRYRLLLSQRKQSFDQRKAAKRLRRLPLVRR